MKTLLTLIFFLCFSFGAHAQSPSVKEYVEEHRQGRAYFVYQSVLRIINLDGNKDFNDLIKNIRRIVIHRIGDFEESPFDEIAYSNLQTNLINEGYEELISVRSPEMKLKLMSKGVGKDSEYLLTTRMEDGAAIVELDGQLDLKNIAVLANSDMSNFQKILDQNFSFD